MLNSLDTFSLSKKLITKLKAALIMQTFLFNFIHLAYIQVYPFKEIIPKIKG